MKKQSQLLATTILAIIATGSAHAVEFDGFMTAGASINDDKTNSNVYLGALGDRGITNNLTFEADTRFGLQISSDISEKMSVVSQLLGTGTRGNFNAVIEWAYIDYAVNNVTNVHVGKIKQPVYLVNDYVEVGYAYPWIRPPGEVYYQNNPLNTVNGIEFLIQYPVGRGLLSFQPYLGSNREAIPNSQGSYFEAENIYGIDIKYTTSQYTVHASAFQCEVKTFGGFVVEGTPYGDLNVDLNGEGDCTLSAAGINLDINNVVVYAEYTKRTTDNTLSRAFGDQTAWYGTIGYRMGAFLPHLTIAQITGQASTVGIDTGEGAVTGGTLPPGASFNFPVALQTSVTAGLRYEVNDSAALKVEYQVVHVEDDKDVLASANQSSNYGLFSTDFTKQAPEKNVALLSVSLDVIF